MTGVEAEREPDQLGDEFTPAPVPAISLFGDDPVKAYEKMNACVQVIRDAFGDFYEQFVKELTFGRGERKRTSEHVKIEGWTFVGSLVGVTARTRSTTRLEGEFDGEWWADDGTGRRTKFSGLRPGHGYKAHAEAVTLGGSVVGGGVGLCLNTEERWENSDEYARQSMAQTRARANAIAGVLRFLVEMAGYSGTPAEEMTGVEDRGEREYRQEGPKLERIDGWGKLTGKLDELAGFTEGVSKGLYADSVAATWGIAITKWNDIEQDPGGSARYAEAKLRLHKIMWALQAKDFGLGVAPTEDVVAAWNEHWPLEAGSVADGERQEKIEAAADVPAPTTDGESIPFGEDDKPVAEQGGYE